MITKNISYDNPSETPAGTIVGNFTDCQPVMRQIKIRVGYTQTNSDIFIVNNLREFKQALIDGYLNAEHRRRAEFEKILTESELTEEEKFFQTVQIASGKKFHQIDFPKKTWKKHQAWGNAQRNLKQQPRLEIFLIDNRQHNTYLHSPTHNKTGNWFFGGFDFSKINYEQLYNCTLETAEHCSQIDGFLTAFNSINIS
jgi:hypothetical protein